MKRYIKCNGNWIDTLIEQRDYGRYYYVIDNIVKYFSDDISTDYTEGEFEDESDYMCNE